MKKGKNFFYRVNPTEVLAVVGFEKDRESWFLQFFRELQNDDIDAAKIPLAAQIISESNGFRALRAEAGKASAEKRTNKSQHMLTDVQQESTSVQQKSTSSSSSNNIKPKEKVFSEEGKKLAWLLVSKISARNPDLKGMTTEPEKIETAKKWAGDMDLLLRVDKVDFEEAKRVLTWCQQDGFWCTNILSGAKFRKQFAQLQVKSKAPNPKEKPTPENNPKCVTPEWF